MMMKMITITTALLLAGGVATAQQTPASPESIRPMDTEPSIPVETPVLNGAGATGAAGTVDPDAPVSSDAMPAGGAGGYGAPGQQSVGAEASGLPVRTAAARTLRAHWHVYIAFSVAWLLLFGYALSIGWRMKKLERELAARR